MVEWNIKNEECADFRLYDNLINWWNEDGYEFQKIISEGVRFKVVGDCNC